MWIFDAIFVIYNGKHSRIKLIDASCRPWPTIPHWIFFSTMNFYSRCDNFHVKITLTLSRNIRHLQKRPLYHSHETQLISEPLTVFTAALSPSRETHIWFCCFFFNGSEQTDCQVDLKPQQDSHSVISALKELWLKWNVQVLNAIISISHSCFTTLQREILDFFLQYHLKFL